MHRQEYTHAHTHIDEYGGMQKSNSMFCIEETYFKFVQLSYCLEFILDLKGVCTMYMQFYPFTLLTLLFLSMQYS